MQQNALDGWRHLATSFLPVDALDGSFGAGRLAVVHTAPPAGSYALEPRCTKRDKRGKKSLPVMLSEQSRLLFGWLLGLTIFVQVLKVSQAEYIPDTKTPAEVPFRAAGNPILCCSAIRFLDSTPSVFQPAQIISKAILLGLRDRASLQRRQPTRPCGTKTCVLGTLEMELSGRVRLRLRLGKRFWNTRSQS